VNDEQELMRICDKFNIGNFMQKVNARFSQLRVRFVLKKQGFFKRYPDLPNRPDKAFGFDSGNPDTQNLLPV
jgi:hypothetical protein